MNFSRRNETRRRRHRRSGYRPWPGREISWLLLSRLVERIALAQSALKRDSGGCAYPPPQGEGAVVSSAPAPQADPGLAVEPVALDRHLSGADRVHHALAGILEAAFVDDAARRGVDDAARDVERVDRRCPERQIDQRVRGLGGIAVPPVRFADPVADLEPMAAGVEPGAADEGAGVGKRQRIDAARTRVRRGSTARRRGPPPRRRGAACAPASRRRGDCWRARRARGCRPDAAAAAPAAR